MSNDFVITQMLGSNKTFHTNITFKHSTSWRMFCCMLFQFIFSRKKRENLRIEPTGKKNRVNFVFHLANACWHPSSWHLNGFSSECFVILCRFKWNRVLNVNLQIEHVFCFGKSSGCLIEMCFDKSVRFWNDSSQKWQR